MLTARMLFLAYSLSAGWCHVPKAPTPDLSGSASRSGVQSPQHSQEPSTTLIDVMLFLKVILDHEPADSEAGGHRSPPASPPSLHNFIL